MRSSEPIQARRPQGNSNMSELGERYERESADPNSREVLEWAKEPGRRGLSGGLGGINAIVGPKLGALVQNLYDFLAVRLTVAPLLNFPLATDPVTLYLQRP